MNGQSLKAGTKGVKGGHAGVLVEAGGVDSTQRQIRPHDYAKGWVTMASGWGPPWVSLRTGFLLAVAAVASVVNLGCPTSGLGDPGSPLTCLGCHNGRTAQDMRLFLLSTHKAIACDVCHVGAAAHVESGGLGGSLINPANAPFELSYAVCATCHQETVAEFNTSVHSTSRKVACYDCHNVHSPSTTIWPVNNNLLCRSCHVFGGFLTDAEIEDHTKHPNDPTGTGASRCVFCHMVPTERTGQEDGPHSHTFMTVPPIESNIAAMNGVVPTPPNSCAGITGCHDGTVPTAPVFDVDNQATMTGLQGVYELWFSKAAP